MSFDPIEKAGPYNRHAQKNFKPTQQPKGRWAPRTSKPSPISNQISTTSQPILTQTLDTNLNESQQHASGPKPKTSFPPIKVYDSQQAYKARLINLKKITTSNRDFNSKKTADCASILALDYLFKGAKHTDPKLQSPVTNFNCLHPTYYRSMGNGLFNFYSKWFKTKYECIFKANNNPNKLFQSFALVKSKTFMRLIKAEAGKKCNYVKLKLPTYLDSSVFETRLAYFEKELIEKSKKPPGSRPEFYNVNKLICHNYRSEVLTPESLKYRLEKIAEVIHKVSPKNIDIGSMINLGKGQHACMILYGENSGVKTETLEQLRQLGYFPDVEDLEKALVEHGFDLDAIEFHHQFGLSNVNSINNSHPLHSNKLLIEVSSLAKRLAASNPLTNALSEPPESNPQFYFYGLLSKLFEKFETTLIVDPTNERLIANSLENMLGILKALDQKTYDFEQYIYNIELLFEEVHFLTQFTGSQDLNGTIKKLSQLDQLSHEAFVYTSGMNAYSQLICALQKTNKNRKLKVNFSNSSYFELIKVMNPHIAANMDIKTSAFLQGGLKDTQDLDIIFGDVIPNDVNQSTIKEIDYSKILPLNVILERKTPLTLVLDVTTILFCDPKIKALVNYYRTAIACGKLNLILVDSLEKFQAGTDKRPSGALVMYTADGSNSLKRTLLDFSVKESVGVHTQQYINNLLALDDGGMILKYIELIRENTLKFANILKEKAKKARPDEEGFVIVKKKTKKETYIKCIDIETPQTPLLVIQFANDVSKALYPSIPKECLASLLRDFMIQRASQHGLFLPKRPSFGFDKININECLTALRLSIGLEDTKTLENYADFIYQMEKTIDSEMQNNKLEIINLINEIGSKKSHEHVDIIFRKNKCHKQSMSFVDFLKHIRENSHPLAINV